MSSVTQHDLLGPSSASSFPLTTLVTVIDTTGTSIIPGWANPTARNFRPVNQSICIDRGSDGLIKEDRADIDNDTNKGVVNQREYLMSDEALIGPNDTTREVLVPNAAAFIPNLFTGFDENPFGKICDIGTDEYRIIQVQAEQ